MAARSALPSSRFWFDDLDFVVCHALPPVALAERFDLFLPIFFPLWFPYIWAFWQSGPKADAERIKKGIALALSWGVSLLFISCSSIAAIWFYEEVDNQSVIVSVVLAVVQIALIISAMKTYYSMKRESWDWSILGMRLWIAIPAIALVLASFQLGNEDAIYESVAVGSLRSIRIAQDEYAKAHPDKGFASSLAELGPRPGDELIDPVLSSGRKKSYIFTLNAADPDQQGHIARYTITARPRRYTKTVRRSFFLDESGVIRYTGENRAPTSQDQPL
jgi:hypothetical protein